MVCRRHLTIDRMMPGARAYTFGPPPARNLCSNCKGHFFFPFYPILPSVFCAAPHHCRSIHSLSLLSCCGSLFRLLHLIVNLITSAEAELDAFLNNWKRCTAEHAVHQMRLGEMWGNGPSAWEPTAEDKAPLLSTLLFTWIYPQAVEASREALTKESIPLSPEPMQSHFCGRRLSRAVQTRLHQCHAWRPLLGREVYRKDDETSRGTLRWIGMPQQGGYTEVMAGVEWATPPRPSRGGGASEFFDGVAYGERLFDPEGRGCSTLEHPHQLKIALAQDFAFSPPTLPQRLRLFRCLLSTLPNYVVWQIPFSLCSVAASLAGPMLLKKYVAYIEKEEFSRGYGLLIAAALGGTFVVQPVLRHRALYMSICAGWQVRSAISSLIFEKSLTISLRSAGMPSMNAGRVTNMLSTDVERIMQFFGNLDTIWCSPLQLLLAIVLLYRLIGWCTLAGLGIIIGTLPLNAYLTALQVEARRSLSAATDARVRATNEFLSGIRVTKFMSWEPRFVQEIEKKRAMELQLLKRIQYCRAAMAFVSNATPTLMIAVVFTLLYIMGHEINPTTVFPTLALFNLVRGSFMELPFVITCVVQLHVAIERVERYLECGNRSHSTIKDIREADASVQDVFQAGTTAIHFQNVDVTAYVPAALPRLPVPAAPLWRRVLPYIVCCEACRPQPPRPPLSGVGDAEGGASGIPTEAGDTGKTTGGDDFFDLQPKRLLEGVNVRVPRGKLTVVIGPTGSGKSTFVQAALSQLEISNGEVWATKSIAYVPQQPWIMNATVRENVLFFSEERDEPLREALRVSQLETDLGLMANGLETEIGEKGINLSGGQKARVSLARAVYADREMYLLDDPLSALDAHVGERVLHDCFLGHLQGKTRVLATHHVNALPYADYVVVLKDQRVAFAGDRDAFQRSGIDAALQLTQAEPTLQGRESGAAQDGTAAANAAIKVPGDAAGAAAGKTAAGQLMTREEKAAGAVPLSTYTKYAKYCGGTPVMTRILLLFGVTEALSVASTVWLSLWSTDSLGISVGAALRWYLALALLGTVGAPLRSLVGYAAMRRGGTALHSALLRSVSIATMEFFDTTPLGRIVHRFSRDIDALDSTLQMALLGVLEYSMAIISSTTIAIVSIPLFALALVPSLFFFRHLLRFYGSASRETRRFISILKSPVFSLLSEMTSGTATIHAYNADGKFMSEANRRIDLVTNCSNFGALLHRWLGVRVELANAVLISVIAVVGVLLPPAAGTRTALVSLSLTMGMQMSATVLKLLRQTVTVETEMNSMERLLYYIEEIPHEAMETDLTLLRDSTGGRVEEASCLDTVAVAALDRSDAVVSAGSLEFRNVQMRYREGLPLVLRDVTFCIAPREKVGVVGRTGSGKSTLMLTFMRMVDICGGEILVNGSGIRTYPLRELRKQFSMIPQDPVLFDGTVRQNLDPFQESSAEEVWEALTLCGLRERVESETGGLDGRVLEGGSNFSVGQRQLLCMARALLRKGSGFILMDEATANIDPTLDRYIQSTVMNAFAEYTVITIAHRLHTVANYDKIIVMDQGVVAETGTPRELVSNRQSIFRGMVEALGPTGVAEFTNLITH
eukprot:gene11320-7852_t